MDERVSLLPLGGCGDVTRNMFVYSYRDQILIVDCGLGFPDETMLGVDLLLPDITSVLSSGKRIVGMVLTHGHEDHIGALPFIIPQLPVFPIFGSPFTAELSNGKLKEFGINTRVQKITFDKPEVKLGAFDVSFIHVTHSVPDTSHIFIKTPVGNFYHGSDYKFDLTPHDRQPSDFLRIAKAGQEGVLCMLSDCLGSERDGYTPSEEPLLEIFEHEMRKSQGRFIFTTYSSHIARLNQIISLSQKLGKKVCFVGRSLLKTKEVAYRLKYLNMNPGLEVPLDRINKFKDSELVLIVAGSQGQENSAMSRIANGEHDLIELKSTDTVMFSSDAIPGNEISVNSLIDSIAKRGTRVLYSGSSKYHVSGHGSRQDILLLTRLTKPQLAIPIGGTYKHMSSFKNLLQKIGYLPKNIVLVENGQELIFTPKGVSLGKKINVKKVYVDEITGEELEGVVLRDRQKLSEAGIVIVVSEIDSETGQFVVPPDVITRGLSGASTDVIVKKLQQELQKTFQVRKGPVSNWVHIRRLLGETSERLIFKEFRIRPLVLPVVIEV